MAKKMRKEFDSLGEQLIPDEKYWGAQTQRALKHFKIGDEVMPISLIRALALIKKSAARAHQELMLLDAKKTKAIVLAAEEIIQGKHDDNFLLAVWQTGSGTQTNMNVNEVIANRASEILGGKKGAERLIHPNDDVNKSQSSNDVFPTAMHMVITDLVINRLLPSLEKVKKTFQQKEKAFKNVIKIGRTHLQDAVSLTLGQEFSAYTAQMNASISMIKKVLPELKEVALGGTAVGTGLNAPKDFAKKTIRFISQEMGVSFKPAKNKFAALASHDALLNLSGALKTLATSFMKIADDIRWLSSGPRCGLNEITIPANEPGSSIMPGKINPTQCEAMMMVCAQVMGNDVTIGIAGSRGNFQLNVMKPVIAYNLIQSLTLLSDASISLNDYLLKGINVNQERIDAYFKGSLMMVTSLTPVLGYDQAAKIAQYAHQKNLTIKEACLKMTTLNEKEIDRLLKV